MGIFAMELRASLPQHCPASALHAAPNESFGRPTAQRPKRCKLAARTVTCQAADLALGASLPTGPPRKIAIFVEPSPFSHVSGMKIRFTNLIKGLRDIGDDVCVFTPCVDPPKTFHGAKVCSTCYYLQGWTVTWGPKFGFYTRHQKSRIQITPEMS